MRIVRCSYEEIGGGAVSVQKRKEKNSHFNAPSTVSYSYHSD